MTADEARQLTDEAATSTNEMFKLIEKIAKQGGCKIVWNGATAQQQSVLQANGYTVKTDGYITTITW